MASAIQCADAEHIYVDADQGRDASGGKSPGAAVKTLDKALRLVKAVGRPLSEDLIVHLKGTFAAEALVVNQRTHWGTSRDARVVFRGDEGARILGGQPLDFVRASSLPAQNPARKLASRLGLLDELWAAAPPSGFPTSDQDLRWLDADCRDHPRYAAPPTLSLGGMLMDRSREPNPPPKSYPYPEMGEVRDKWLRTTQRSVNTGSVNIGRNARASVNLASDDSWEKAVHVHMYNM